MACLQRISQRSCRLRQQMVSGIRIINTSSSKPAHNNQQLEEIKIPNRIHREPTDLLKALASTVKKDFRSPSYSYIDDPETIPTSTTNKKAYALAKASGRRAAQFVIKKWPKMFERNPADPSIECLLPPSAPQNAEDSLEGLEERLELRLVDESYASYQKNIQAGSEVPAVVLQNLLDLLCVYNSHQPNDPFLMEEQPFSRLLTPDGSSKKVVKTWRDDGLAEELFVSLSEPQASHYCSIIRGRAKFHQVDKAYSLFLEMKSKGLKPDVATYNAIIGLAGYLNNMADAKVDFIKEQFKSMVTDGVEPNLETFNNALAVMSRTFRFNHRLVSQFTTSLLSEMAACGIKPSLGTWYHVIRTYYCSDDLEYGVLGEIVDYLENQRDQLEANEPTDLEFFSTAMTKCHVNLKDLELANRIDSLLNHGQNYRLIGDNFKEGLYYNFYLKTLCMFEQIDTITENYERIVPHSFTPTYSALDDLIEALELNEGFEYIPKIWSDVHSFGYKSLQIFEGLSALMAKRQHPEALQQQMLGQLLDYYGTIRVEVMTLEEKEEIGRTEQLPGVSAPLLSSICQVCLHSEEKDTAREVFDFFLDYKNKIRGTFPESPLINLIDVFFKENDFDSCYSAVSVMADYAHASLEKTVDRIKIQMPLSEDQIKMLDDLL